MRHIALILITLLFLTSCASTGNNNRQETLPPWVMNPPSDTKIAYFGVGQGLDLIRAKNRALQEISSKISIFVGGRSEITSTLRNDFFQESALTQIKTQTQDKKLVNYSVEQTAQSNGQIYVLVSIAKAGLVESWSLKLRQLDQTIAAEVAALKQDSALEQYMKWQQTLPKVMEAASLISLIKEVDSSFQTTSYDNRYRRLQNQAREVTNNLNIYVNSTPDLRPVSKKIIKQLTASGIKTSASRSKHTNAVVEIKGIERKQFIFDSYTIELRLTLTVWDITDKVIASNPVNISGGSIIDYASARISAAKNLEIKIKEIGILAMLGLVKI